MRAAALALALVPGVAWGQDDPCAAAWDALTATTGIPVTGAASLSLDGWCEVTGARLGGAGDHAALARIERLRWRDGLLAEIGRIGPATPGVAPGSFEMSVEGLTLGAATGDPLLDWALAAQARPNGIDGNLSLAWDAAARELRLTHLALDFPGDNAFAATATLTGVDLSSEAAIQASLGSVALSEAEASITSHGLFEGYLLLPLAEAVLGGSADPAAEAEALKGRVAAEIATLPPSVFPNPTRENLAALLAELPNPAGTLTLSLATAAGGGLGPARFARFMVAGMPRSLEEAWAALDGVTIRAGWQPDQPRGWVLYPPGVGPGDPMRPAP